MNILVLIKIVSKSTYADTLQDIGERLNGGSLEINPADMYALEMALRIKDRDPETVVTVMTMAPDSAEYYLKETIAMGADQAVLVSDRQFAGSDTLATAKVLFEAISELPHQDLILCGKKSTDSETGHIGPQVARMLGFPCATNVISFEEGAEAVKLIRAQEDGLVQYQGEYPLLLCLCIGNQTVRVPTILSRKQARNATVKILRGEDLPGLQKNFLSEIGINHSLTKVVRVQTVAFRKGKGISTSDFNAGVDTVLRYLKKTGMMSRGAGDTPAHRAGDPGHVLMAEHTYSNLIWVLGEYNSPSFPGLVFQAEKLAQTAGYKVKVIPFLSGGGAGPNIGLLDEEAQAAQLLALLWKSERPRVILFESSVPACSIAPALSVLINAGITADCTKLEMTPDGVLMQTRPTYGNRKLATIVNRAGTAMATVRKGVFPLPEGVHVAIPDMGETADLWHAIAGISSSNRFQLVRRIGTQQKMNITDAQIVLSGGLGLGSKENFSYLTELATLMNRSGCYGRVAVGATRAAVAAGYMSYDHQVGQTGCSVSPKLYLAFGISGAVQHLSGMTGSETIIAVNTDPGAAIHGVSDYSVIGDCNQVIQALIHAMSE